MKKENEKYEYFEISIPGYYIKNDNELNLNLYDKDFNLILKDDLDKQVLELAKYYILNKKEEFDNYVQSLSSKSLDDAFDVYLSNPFKRCTKDYTNEEILTDFYDWLEYINVALKEEKIKKNK